MKKFLSQQDIYAEWVEEPDRLGYHVQQVSRFNPGPIVYEQDGTVTVYKKTMVGRPSALSLRCKMCHFVAGPMGAMDQHFKRKHATEDGQYTDLPKRIIESEDGA